jgi:hypothetical protein
VSPSLSSLRATEQNVDRLGDVFGAAIVLLYGITIAHCRHSELVAYRATTSITARSRRSDIFEAARRLAERRKQAVGTPNFVERTFDIVTGIRASGTTVLMVEQNASAALDMCDHAYLLESGSLALAGSGRELIGNPHVRAAYLAG